MAALTCTRASRRTIRVIKCLRLLQAACYSADDLADRLDVSKRTVYRDLRLLTEAGVPLVKHTGGGGYRVALLDPP